MANKTIGDAEDTLLLVLQSGIVGIHLDPDIAPLHVERIKTLSRSGEYDDVIFHRVVPNFVAQAGDVQYGDRFDGYDPQLVGTGGSTLPDLPLEATDKESFVLGAVGMARAADPDSANSQFFIVTADSTFLDGDYTWFGEVIGGMRLVEDIPPTFRDSATGAVTGNLTRILSALVADDIAPGRTSIGTSEAERVEGLRKSEAAILFGGDDRATTGKGADTVLGGDGADTILGGGGKDRVLGENGKDKIKGGGGDDDLDGGAHRDLLVGGRGDDTLTGGAGDDRLKGGGGSDVFRFAQSNFGDDRIKGGFTVGEDVIDLQEAGYTLENLSLSREGKNTVIDVADGLASITVIGATDLIGNEDTVFLFG